MSHVFVVSASQSSVEKEPRLCYKNLSSTSSSIVATHDNANTAYLYDSLTTLKWRPENTTPSITYTGSFSDVDFVGIAGANWATAVCTITVKDSLGTVLGTASNLRDNQPVLFSLDKGAQAVILIEFSCSNTLLEVGEIYFGESMKFPRNVSVGYQPGRWTSNDLISSGRTEANQFAGSTIKARGTTERFRISHVPIDFMDSDYVDFIRLARGVPVFFLWSKSLLAHSVFGNWNASSPSYNAAYLSEISLTINGVA